MSKEETPKTILGGANGWGGGRRERRGGEEGERKEGRGRRGGELGAFGEEKGRGRGILFLFKKEWLVLLVRHVVRLFLK